MGGWWRLRGGGRTTEVAVPLGRAVFCGDTGGERKSSVSVVVVSPSSSSSSSPSPTHSPTLLGLLTLSLRGERGHVRRLRVGDWKN